MKKTTSLVLAAVICFVMLAGCGTKVTTNGKTRIITDGAGREVEVPEKVESIVCVGPAGSDITSMQPEEWTSFTSLTSGTRPENLTLNDCPR